MYDRSGDGTGSSEVKIRTNTAKFTNMIIARFRESRNIGQVCIQRSSGQGQGCRKKGRKSLLPQCKTSSGHNSGSLKDSAKRFAHGMCCSNSLNSHKSAKSCSVG